MKENVQMETRRGYVLAMVHGEDEGKDKDRRLTPFGEQQVRSLAKACMARYGHLCTWTGALYLPHPHLRQTAAIACEELGIPCRPAHALDVAKMKENSPAGEAMFGPISAVIKRLKDIHGPRIPIGELLEHYAPLHYVAGLFEGHLCHEVARAMEGTGTGDTERGIVLVAHRICAELLCFRFDQEITTLPPGGAVLYEFCTGIGGNPMPTLIGGHEVSPA